jgi:hypothetical protein
MEQERALAEQIVQARRRLQRHQQLRDERPQWNEANYKEARRHLESEFQDRLRKGD